MLWVKIWSTLIGVLPIRKTSPNEVVLSSYYGPKQFITRASRKNNDYGIWLANQIRLIGLDNENETITNIHTGNDFDRDFSCIYIYSILARNFTRFNIREFECTFDHKKREEIYGIENLKTYEGTANSSSRLIFGKSQDNRFLVFGEDGLVYIGENKLLRPLGTFESLIGIDDLVSPIEYVNLRVIDKNIPLGVILAYEMGLDNLLKSLRVKYDLIDGTIRALTSTSSFFTIWFKDKTLMIYRSSRKTDMILSGLREYQDFIRNRTYREFDNKEIYLPMLESRKLTLRYLSEIDNLYDMFIDPITEKILVMMKEPTSFRGLLLRSVELLLKDTHPYEMDTEFQRIKGNERIAGAVYRELVRSIRKHRTRSDKARAPIEMNPHAVWKAIADDSSKLLIDEINPIENLKEMEAVTFSGTGGRAAETMMAKARIFTNKDMGIISEAGVDSGDVGVNIWTSANPNITSIYGTTKQLNGDRDPTKLFSTSTLLAPFADKED